MKQFSKEGSVAADTELAFSKYLLLIYSDYYPNIFKAHRVGSPGWRKIQYHVIQRMVNGHWNGSSGEKDKGK